MEPTDATVDEMLDELVEMIHLSALSDDDRTMWFSSIVRMSDEELAMLWFALKDSPVSLGDMTSMIRKKMEAIATMNQTAWDETMQKEKEALSALL